MPHAGYCIGIGIGVNTMRGQIVLCLYCGREQQRSGQKSKNLFHGMEDLGYIYELKTDNCNNGVVVGEIGYTIVVGQGAELLHLFPSAHKEMVNL